MDGLPPPPIPPGCPRLGVELSKQNKMTKESSSLCEVVVGGVHVGGAHSGGLCVMEGEEPGA